MKHLCGTINYSYHKIINIARDKLLSKRFESYKIIQLSSAAE